MAVGWYVWILTLFPVTIRESLTLLDCTMQSNGKRTLDIDPAVTCDDIYMTLFGIGCFLFYLLGFIFTIVLFRCLSFGDFKWIDQASSLSLGKELWKWIVFTRSSPSSKVGSVQMPKERQQPEIMNENMNAVEGNARTVCGQEAH